jgi:hypothetical protein
MSLTDNYDKVYETLQINVMQQQQPNRPPYVYGSINSKSVRLNGHLTIDLSTNFYDDDCGGSSSLIINIAKYTFNGVSYSIPGSIFSLLQPRKIKVDPTAFSQLGTYTIDVSVTDGLLLSDFGTFNVEVTNTAPRFTSVIPTVSATYGVTTTVNLA